MDQEFTTISKIRSQPYLNNFHQSQRIGSHTAVFSTYHTTPFNFSDIDGATDEHKWVFENRGTEIDIDTDNVLVSRTFLTTPTSKTLVKNALDNDEKDIKVPSKYMHLNR